jgi:stearoyl-CoA desaturase (delta-9 desaturase)
MAIILTFFILQWYLSALMQSIFLHRYAAHKMFAMGPFAEKIFYILTWLFQGPSYLSANAYGILHRMHHAHADTEEDPHSPSYDKSMIAMMWRTGVIYSNILYRKVPIDKKYMVSNPEWRSFDLFASSWAARISFGIVYSLIYIWAEPPVWMYALLPVQWLMGPVHGAIINWCAHKWGYRNYDISDTSKNFVPIDLLTVGESYHNNHHANPKNANFGVRFFELDVSYYVIRLLDLIGVVQLPQKHPN